MHNSTIKKTFGLCGAVLVGLLLLNFQTDPVIAETVEELQSQISDQQRRIDEINKEIEIQKQKVTTTAAQAKTLQNTVNALEASRRKIEVDMDETKAQIFKSELTLEKIGHEIVDKEEKIGETNNALGESLRRLNELTNVTTIEQLLSYDNFSDFWNNFKSLQQFQSKVIDTVLTLKGLQTELKDKHVETEKEKEYLEHFAVELAGEEEAVEYAKKEKASLLAQTKSQEAEYQKILNQKLSEKEQFEKELFNFESKLKSLVDPSSIPSGSKGLFTWPVSSVYITQLFGETAFAKTTTLYSRPFHNGVDFGIPLGSKVHAVLGGTVMGSDNTDAYPGCRSWGQWILVKHDNGLSTLYAHLSSRLVSIGQKVATDEVIGLSGSSGVSTGPHLHLTVYASQGVQVRSYREIAPSSSGCGATGATIPVASLDAYLDPMKYLP